MAKEFKSKRVVAGTIFKPREGKETFALQINLWDKEFPSGSITLTNKQYLNIELIDVQLKNLEAALASGKITEEVHAKSQARLSKAKEKNVFAELTLYRDNESK